MKKTVEWHNLVFDISNSNVYPPKPASMLLAEAAARIVKAKDNVLDICTGSGIVPIYVSKMIPTASVFGSDISREAIEVAEKNARQNKVKVEFLISDFYSTFSKESFDVITVHPPAIPYPALRDWGMSQGMRLATNGGEDGSELVCRAISEAKSYLKKGGKLLLLLPHWSNTEKAIELMKREYSDVQALQTQKIEFFAVKEGKPDQVTMDHIKQLAKQGIIELENINGGWFSKATVFQAIQKN